MRERRRHTPTPTDLVDAGVLDSLLVVELLARIEDAFDIVIDTTRIVDPQALFTRCGHVQTAWRRCGHGERVPDVGPTVRWQEVIDFYRHHRQQPVDRSLTTDTSTRSLR